MRVLMKARDVVMNAIMEKVEGGLRASTTVANTVIDYVASEQVGL